MSRLTLLAGLFALSLTACLGGDGDEEVTPGPGHDPGEPPVTEDRKDENLNSYAGDFAHDILSSGTFTELIVEVDYVSGHAPDAGALAELKAVLEELCNKPVGVKIITDDEIPPQGSPTWTYNSAEQLEVTWRDRYRDASTGTEVLYFLYLDGNSDSDTSSGRVLGYAYHGSSVVMFKETISSAGSGGILGIGAADIEAPVIVHEAGHLLGLVNNGTNMVTPHQDTAHGHHCDNEDCLMYWAAETDVGISDMLLGGNKPDFDAECRDDMIANGGKP